MPTIFQPGGEDPKPNDRWEKTTARAQASLEHAAPDDSESFVEVLEQDGRIVVHGSIQPPFDVDKFCQAICDAINTLQQSNGKGKACIRRDSGGFDDNY